MIIQHDSRASCPRNLRSAYLLFYIIGVNLTMGRTVSPIAARVKTGMLVVAGTPDDRLGQLSR